jgi:DNA helicase-2/ATP-dependent DNA helicase PcrA
VIDFEDLLRAAAWAIEEHADVADQIRAQYRHLVVDEYQDVNPLQQRLLDAWLGGRDDLTVVGDASQTIYSFTGATSDYLVDFARRYPGATVVRLVRDYRSTPQIVGLANSIIGSARGAQAKLRLELIGQRPAGPAPDVRVFADEAAEAGAVAKRCLELISAGTAAHAIAILFRTNAQSEAYEQALAEAGVPYVVQGAERFFDRAEVRAAMVALRAASRGDGADAPLVESVIDALARTGWRPEQPPSGGAARERWEALAALVSIARSMPPAMALADFGAELARRAVAQHAPTVDGVVLSSLHSAKGLEWDAVFLVGLAEGTLPTVYAKTADQLEEERRLLYVGITRARHWLWLSYGSARSPGGRARRASRFLASVPGLAGQKTAPRTARRAGVDAVIRTQIALCRICGTTLLSGADRKLGRCAGCPSDIDEQLHQRLLDWRAVTAAAQQIPAYVVFTDATIQAIAERRPSRPEELIAIAGIGPRKLGLYGVAVLSIVAGQRGTEAGREVP